MPTLDPMPATATADGGTGRRGIPAPGFVDAIAGAQQTFRAALDALARPTRPVALRTLATAPGALTATAGALILTLCDDSTPVWLDAVLREDADVVGWIAFHTGAPIVDEPARAAFAIVADSAAIPPLAGFGLGTDEAPHIATTLIVGAREDATTVAVVADGPGFPEPARWGAPVPGGFVSEWRENAAIFPRGVDVLFAASVTIVGLPRTTRLVRAEAFVREAR